MSASQSQPGYDAPDGAASASAEPSAAWQRGYPVGLEAAIVRFKRELPGWYYSVCECQVSCDATCAPTTQSPDVALAEHGNDFDHGFLADLAQPATLAAALIDVMEQALEAKRRRATANPADAQSKAPEAT